jgi:ELWxxDGT repeat protein
MYKKLTFSIAFLVTLNLFSQSQFPQQIKDLHPGYRSSLSNSLSSAHFFDIGKTNNKLVFAAYNNFVGADTNNLNFELFVSDGTESGTTLLKEINPNGPSYIRSFFTFRNKVYFHAYDGSFEGEDMWVSDGSVSGTTFFKNIGFRRFYDNLNYPNVIELDSLHFLFSGDSSTIKTNLYISDGTPNGTYTVKDFNPTNLSGFNSNAAPGNFTKVANGKVVFTASTVTLGRELYVTDGTNAGTFLLKNINPGNKDFLTFNDGFTYFHSDGQKAYFFANDSVHGAEIWVTDGTVDGTRLVKDINPGPGKSLVSLTNFATLNGITYFIAKNPDTGNELYKTDGTEAGTSLVMDYKPGVGNGIGEYLLALNNKLVFAASSDGMSVNLVSLSENSTVPVPLLNLFYSEVPIDYYPSTTVLLKENIFCDKLYFSYPIFVNGIAKFQIGVTDATASGTGLILDSLSNPTGATVDLGYWGAGFIEYNNQLVFKGSNGNLGYELFKMPFCAEANTTVDNTINISENKNLQDFVVFPNPSSTYFKLVIPQSKVSFQLSITDISGKQLFEKNGLQDQEIIEHNLPNGIYFVTIKGEKGNSTKKLLVNN